MVRRRRSVSYVGGATGEVVHGPGADAVPGVLEHRRQGFVPLEDLPMTWAPVWDVWPAEHRATVPETREAWWA